jgi:hypothetical protein
MPDLPKDLAAGIRPLRRWSRSRNQKLSAEADLKGEESVRSKRYKDLRPGRRNIGHREPETGPGLPPAATMVMMTPNDAMVMTIGAGHAACP